MKIAVKGLRKEEGRRLKKGEQRRKKQRERKEKIIQKKWMKKMTHKTKERMHIERWREERRKRMIGMKKQGRWSGRRQ